MKEIEKDPQRITKLILLLINIIKKEWTTHKNSWLKKIEKNNLPFALDILYAKNEKIFCTYVSKHNSNKEKQIILLIFQMEQDDVIFQ